jgi:two-component system CheB/CheR fusion protein
MHDVEWGRADSTTYWDVTLAPVVADHDRTIGFSLTFNDITRFRGLEDELARSRREGQSAYEELQSTVEELETINDELRQRSTELNEASFFFESVLMGLRAGVAVTDRELRIQVWNREADNL